MAVLCLNRVQRSQQQVGGAGCAGAGPHALSEPAGAGGVAAADKHDAEGTVSRLLESSLPVFTCLVLLSRTEKQDADSKLLRRIIDFSTSTDKGRNRCPLRLTLGLQR